MPVLSLFKSEVVTAPIVFPHGTAALIVLPESVVCRCGYAVRLVINRNGQTLCVSCDPGEPALQTSAPTP